MKIFHFLGSGFAQIFWEIVSARAKTLYNNTNSVASRNFSIGNSMICSDIWHKYRELYFKTVIRNFTSR